MKKSVKSEQQNVKIEFMTTSSKRTVDKILEKIIKLLEKSDVNQINTAVETYISIEEEINSDLDF